MKKPNSLLFAILSTLLFLNVSCDKEVLPTSNDSAKATSKSVYLDSNYTWNEEYDAGKYYYYVDINFSGITADVVNKGSVEVFMKSDADYSPPRYYINPFRDSNWRLLPATMYASETKFSYSFVTGKARIMYNNFDWSNDYTPLQRFGPLSVRIVAIPASGKLGKPTVDNNNYTEIQLNNGTNVAQ